MSHKSKQSSIHLKSRSRSFDLITLESLYSNRFFGLGTRKVLFTVGLKETDPLFVSRENSTKRL